MLKPQLFKIWWWEGIKIRNYRVRTKWNQVPELYSLKTLNFKMVWRLWNTMGTFEVGLSVFLHNDKATSLWWPGSRMWWSESEWPHRLTDLNIWYLVGIWEELGGIAFRYNLKEVHHWEWVLRFQTIPSVLLSASCLQITSRCVLSAVPTTMSLLYHHGL